MAFDISIGDESKQQKQNASSFFEFHFEHSARLATALSLICLGDADATRAVEVALRRSSQRWKHLAGHQNQLGWALQQGIDEAHRASSGRQPSALNEATGGYVRGLGLGAAYESMPLNQRAALVVSLHLGWSDDTAGAGFEVAAVTVTTRRTRAMAYLGHHLREPEHEIAAQVRAFFSAAAADVELSVPPAAKLQRNGRQRTWLARGAAAVALTSVIAGGGALVSLRERAPQPAVVERVSIDPPTNSSSWLGPVADQRGGFTALNTSGAARLATSTDGVDWFLASVWNSRAIDLRSEVSSLTRSGGRYIATVEAASAISASVPPKIATSTDLKNWQVRELGLEDPPDIDGLQAQLEVLDVASAEDRLFVSLRTSETLDHRSVGIVMSDVCVEERTVEALLVHLCDGPPIRISRATASADAAETRYFVAQGLQPFAEVFLPPGTDGRRVIAVGDAFATVHGVTGAVATSVDGTQWNVPFIPAEPNRFVLLEGTNNGRAVVVEPRAEGWQATVLEDGVPGVVGDIPLTLDPASVWTRPDLSHGPAGWALFVTTSRPWERTEITAGWAVDAGEWIVSQQPGSDVVTAQSVDGTKSLRYQPSSTAVRRTATSVVVFDPGSNQVLAEIERAQIDEALVSTISPETDVRAQILFSEDGISWRSIWESSGDAWVGTISVGDDEVLLSGTQLTGPPLVVPILSATD